MSCGQFFICAEIKFGCFSLFVSFSLFLEKEDDKSDNFSFCLWDWSGLQERSLYKLYCLTLHLLLHCLLYTEELWKSLDCLFNQMVLVSGSCIWLQNLWTPGWSHVQSRNLSMAPPKTNKYLKRRAQRTEKLAPTTVEIKPSIYHQTAKLGPWCV